MQEKQSGTDRRTDLLTNTETYRDTNVHINSLNTQICASLLLNSLKTQKKQSGTDRRTEILRLSKRGRWSTLTSTGCVNDFVDAVTFFGRWSPANLWPLITGQSLAVDHQVLITHCSNDGKKYPYINGVVLTCWSTVVMTLSSNSLLLANEQQARTWRSSLLWKLPLINIKKQLHPQRNVLMQASFFPLIYK